MSFAPSKKLPQKISSERYKLSQNTTNESQQFSPFGFRSSFDSDIFYRLDVLNSNMIRISQQQQALMPLYNSFDYSEAFEKTDVLSKKSQQKNQEMEDRLNRLEQMLKDFQTRVNQHLSKINIEPQGRKTDIRPLEKNVKSVVVQMNQNNNTLKRISENKAQFQKTLERQIDEETTDRATKLDNRLEKNTEDFNHTVSDIRNGVNVGFDRLEGVVKDLYSKVDGFTDFAETNNSQIILQDLQVLMNNKFQEHIDHFRNKYNQDLDRLFREFGTLRIEMETLNEEKRQTKIQPYLQKLDSYEVTPTERKIKFNNVEQSSYIDELESFNRENTQRLMYRLQTFDEDLDKLKLKYEDYQTVTQTHDSDSPQSKEIWNALLDEIEIAGETYTSLKYQIEGAKKKYFFDIKKIEEKMDTIQRIKKEVQHEVASNPKLGKALTRDLQTIEGFPEQIKELVDEINSNLSTAFARLEIVEEKMQENQDILFKKKGKTE